VVDQKAKKLFKPSKMKCYMYILECSDGSYYTGSTKDLVRRFKQHQNGEGANHTKKRLPVKLIYIEEFDRIDLAFFREKQIQGWSRKKKEALTQRQPEVLKILSACMNDSHYKNMQSLCADMQNPMVSEQQIKGNFDSAQSPFTNTMLVDIKENN